MKTISYLSNLSKKNDQNLLGLKIFALTIILLSIGIVFMYGASQNIGRKLFNNANYFLIRHTIYIFLGIFILMVTWLTSIDFFFRISNLILFFTIFSLILVLLFGIEQKGSKRWLHLIIFNFQPSEIAKINIIIFLIQFYSKNKKKLAIQLKKKYIFSLALIYLISFLIFIQYDFSTAFILFSTSMFVFFISGGPIKYIFYPFLGIPTLYLITYSFPYMKNRINFYLSKFFFNTNILYQEKQAYKILSNSSLIEDNIGIPKISIPEGHTDFYFINIISQSGLIIGFFILFFLFYFYFQLFKLAGSIKTEKYVNLIYGITFLLSWQTIINISSNLGIIPITGVTLPMLSFGGNSIITSCFGIGLILSSLRHSLHYETKKNTYF